MKGCDLLLENYSLCFSNDIVNPFIHFLLVNGGWSQWEVWSSCNVTCDGGVQTRSRTCASPPPRNGGAACQGSNVQSQVCNTNGCPGNSQSINKRNWMRDVILRNYRK